MTNRRSLLRFLDIHQQTPVLVSPYASKGSRQRIQMRLSRLPAKSIALYVEHSAACDTPRRAAANEQLESEGFVSYRMLLPVMRRLFGDIWPDGGP